MPSPQKGTKETRCPAGAVVRLVRALLRRKTSKLRQFSSSHLFQSCSSAWECHREEVQVRVLDLSMILLTALAAAANRAMGFVLWRLVWWMQCQLMRGLCPFGQKKIVSPKGGYLGDRIKNTEGGGVAGVIKNTEGGGVAGDMESN
jgi:hypothetical protein